MTIKIIGNRVDENDLHVWIFVSDSARGWTDIPFTIDTPQFDTLQELVDYLEEKEELIAQCIQGKLDEGIELKQSPDICVDIPDLITDDTILKHLEKEKKIKDKIREMAIKELEKEGEL